MYNRCQWVNYTLPSKLPLSPHTGRAASTTNPEDWGTYQQAYDRDPHHIGFVLTKNDPYFFVDIDNCVEEDGSWSITAMMLFDMFKGCFIERSQSGNGAHIIGTMPVSIEHGCDNKDIGTQFYTHHRYVAMTWTEAQRDVSYCPSEDTYRSFITKWFPVSDPTIATGNGNGPVPEWQGPSDDDELIKMMLASRQSPVAEMQGKPSFWDLWSANKHNLAYKIPREQDPSEFDWSKADSALCSHLAFWTGKDHNRIVRLWGKSKLGDRDKFRKRGKYVFDTVSGACSAVKQVYHSHDGDQAISGKFMFGQDQAQHFEGCVLLKYLIPKVFMPDGGIIGPSAFSSRMGHCVFVMDDNVGKKTTRDAWEAFTKSEVYTPVMANDTCFRPDLPCGQIVEREGQRLVNSYNPPLLQCHPGDPGPFLDLITRMIPDERDRTILLSYMAAAVQHKGAKFRWAPVIQGVEGNGKSIISEFFAYCFGERYVSNINTDSVKSSFNDWLADKLLIYGDEMNRDKDVDIITRLKAFITDRRVSIHIKGVSRVMRDNTANFIFCMNSKDVLKKHRNDRRLTIFYTAQQSYEDIVQAGMDGQYFYNLVAWRENGGYGIVHHFLKHYHIPDEFNPAKGCNRAPDTTSTAEAMELSLSPAESAIKEFLSDEEYCIYGDDRKIQARMFYCLYKDWCRFNEVRPVSNRKFGLEAKKYIQKIHVETGTLYIGIGTDRLIPPM
jgi:hypothetical protein